MDIEDKRTIVELYKPMVYFGDLLMHDAMLKFVQPKNIMELGTGRGSWAMTLHDINKFDCHWHLVENFRYIEKKFKPEYYWPTNEKELTEYIQSNSDIKFSFYNINANEAKNLPLKDIDILRWDCDLPDMQPSIRKLLSKLSEKSIIIVDDVEVSSSLHRLKIMIDFVNEGLLFPLWMGIKEAAFCTSQFDRAGFFESAMHLKEHFTCFEVANNTFIDWVYLRTNENPFLKFFN